MNVFGIWLDPSLDLTIKQCFNIDNIPLLDHNTHLLGHDDRDKINILFLKRR